MPNPKTGTVTTEVGKTVDEFKAGKVEYRTDRYGNVHVPIGKASFESSDLLDNYQAVLDEVMRAKPASAKGRYLKGVAVSSTHGSGRPRRHRDHPRGPRSVVGVGRRLHFRFFTSESAADLRSLRGNGLGPPGPSPPDEAPCSTGRFACLRRPVLVVEVWYWRSERRERRVT